MATAAGAVKAAAPTQGRCAVTTALLATGRTCPGAPGIADLARSMAATSPSPDALVRPEATKASPAPQADPGAVAPSRLGGVAAIGNSPALANAVSVTVLREKAAQVVKAAATCPTAALLRPLACARSLGVDVRCAGPPVVAPKGKRPVKAEEVAEDGKPLIKAADDRPKLATERGTAPVT